ncbi:lipase (class 3) domain-containing protein [Hirsutella rhossiliensis]|uniref:sn-1-specific diacylglycerol lipase n=1 Tax=Hirsutella rhossiliensis TaxID=111463 RepID=A0A9P8MR15_9HYPO|nr:lipase (class 3) domain-containing protein [Hirsutella rhossiliensis]KAH0958904.1 lipase (class 3) domain-containing protein [Hirsutella rhossiliensis]
MARDDIIAAAASLASPHPGPTLLPGPVAHVVSLATRSTSLAIRVGSLVSSYGLDAARFTTLSSLELARGMVEVVLSRAARDTLAQSNSDLAAADAETILERSLESLHYAVSQVVFWTSASFRLTGTTLTAASEASQLVLSSFDQLFGSTDSSRAVASIVTLIRREFNNPATGVRGEKVGVLDLVLALGALAYLQRSCRRTSAEEHRRRSYEETIWDVVVLSDGQRVDIEQGKLTGTQPTSSSLAAQAYDNDEVILARLKNQIINSMPPGTSVAISDTVSSVQTITVDVQGSQLPSLPTPPGAEIVEMRGPASAAAISRSPVSLESSNDTSYRVVYRIEREKMRSTSVRRQDEASCPIVVELPDAKPLQSPSLDASPVGPTESTSGFALASPASAVDADESTGARRQARIVQPSPAEIAANQKKQRSPLTEPSSRENIGRPRPRLDTGKRSHSKKKSESVLPSKSAERRNGLKQVLKGRGQSLSNIWSKEQPSSEASRAFSKPKPQWKSPGGGSPTDSTPGKSKLSTARNPSQPAQRSPPARRPLQPPELEPRAGSRTSFFSIHEHRRDSVVSQADTYSKHGNGELRPASPTIVRTDFTTQESTTRPRSDVYSAQIGPIPPSPHKSHRLSASYAPSLYSLATNDSQSSLVLSSYYQKSTYNGSDALSTLRREGFVDGTFPAGPLLPNIARYMRFSSACYGSHFLKFMGISTELPSLGVWDGTHHDVRHFVHHTESEAGNILLASFVDPQGGADATGSTGTGVPLVHYISLDHAAKAVVLACRGTLGFEDVMADMTCEYDDLTWRGRRYRVHKGMHASARRLLYGGDGRVLVTIKEALREFPDYGLVLCGHSLGAGVTSLLGVMLAQPNPDGPGFVISAESHAKLLTQGTCIHEAIGDLRLPSGRRIHVYAYGPPGVMSASLGKITRGLITSVVHGNDLVPHLSLGLLHDFQALALAFKHDENKTKAEIRRRMWHVVQSNLAERWRRAEPRAPAEADEEQWILPALGALRDSMKGAKLVPPGEVFAIETQRVLRRDAFVLVDDEGPVGRPAQRVVLKYIRDVEARFGEVRFGTGLLMDHSPAKYEDALNMLRLGVVD